jgi:hypothetical protein
MRWRMRAFGGYPRRGALHAWRFSERPQSTGCVEEVGFEVIVAAQIVGA